MSPSRRLVSVFREKIEAFNRRIARIIAVVAGVPPGGMGVVAA